MSVTENILQLPLLLPVARFWYVSVLGRMFAFQFYAFACAVVHLNVADGFIISLTAAFALHDHLHWHPAFCLLALLACWIIVRALQQHPITYRIIFLLFTVGYAYAVGHLVLKRHTPVPFWVRSAVVWRFSYSSRCLMYTVQLCHSTR